MNDETVILPEDPVAQSNKAREEAKGAAEVLGREVPNVTTRRAERVSWRIGIVIGIIAILLSGAGVWISVGVARYVANQAVSQRSEQSKRDADAATTQQAIDQLKVSNNELRARGQAPVASPQAPSLDEALIAAATARVLAALPRQPSEADIRAQVATAVASIPPAGPTSGQISSAVSAYLSANPPPAGPPGDQGPQGDAGPAGSNGTDGADGTNGQDGSQGPQGDVGPAGAAGASGADGTPPLSWTFTVGSDTYTCTRDDPFDEDAPTYNCQLS